MIKSGLLPIRKIRKDYDFHRTFGAVELAQLPDSYSVEANIWNPNQEVANTLFGVTIPPVPEGCTTFAAADVCIDEDHIFHNPEEIEAITHANANGGGDVRQALSTAAKLWGKGAYYNINGSGQIDMFDAIRLALLSTSSEQRAASVGTPFFPIWLNPGITGILQTPNSYSTIGLPWHNYVICGWKTINGVCYLVCKVWLGPNWGDNGFGYMSREICNSAFAINGSGAFTLAQKVDKPETVNMGIVGEIVSYVTLLYAQLFK